MKKETKSTFCNLDSQYVLNILYDIILPESFMLFHVTCDLVTVMLSYN